MNNEFDVAVVGISGRFPGARDVFEFWHNLANGVESITRFSNEELLASGVSSSYVNNRSYVKAAPILTDPDLFDAPFFGFSPTEAKTMDPQHRILLELAYEALENAGYDSNRYQGRVGVFTGAAMNTYFMHTAQNSRFAEDYIPTLIVNDKDFLSTRISYKLNLKGPSVTVQTACSTSLVAVHLARQSLLSEETDMALAGAISVRVPHHAGYFYDAGGVVSPDGHVRAFDARANGTVFGSGGGILVLKRLADALANGDTIHAVITGSAVNNDGSEKAGYTAPSVNGQADAVVEALANAGVTSDSISYIEAHGSGTPAGDPIEIKALTKAFRTASVRSGYCAIGSVKTNVGHLDAAAGVAGIIKTVLALEHRQLPPSLHFNDANPEIDFLATPFYVNTELREWTSDGPRRAGVMSTGMGGTNAHVILEEAPEQVASDDPGTPVLLVMSAKSPSALENVKQNLREFLTANKHVNMHDVAYTLQVGRKAFGFREYLTCDDRVDAINALAVRGAARSPSAQSDPTSRPLVFLLPGVGDHYVGMAHGLYETFEVFRQEVDRCARILESDLGLDIRRIVYPSAPSWKEVGQKKGIDLRKMLGRTPDAVIDKDGRSLNETWLVQPALFTIEYALSRLWQSLGVTPDAIVGHSMGEYVAACLSGVLSLEDALHLIAARARLVNQLPHGAMLAVMLSEQELSQVVGEDLSVALVNGPDLCVVAGPVPAVARLERRLQEKGVTCRPVQNAHAFHSRMLDPIVEKFEDEVRNVRLSKPSIPYISNVTGTWITAAQATDPHYWASHANHTARFSDALRELWRYPNPILLEVGAGRTLSVLAAQHPERPPAADLVVVQSVRYHYENESDSNVMLRGLGTLWASGRAINWDNYHAGVRRRRIALPTYPFERQRYWLETESTTSHNQAPADFISEASRLDDWFYVPTWERTAPPSGGVSDQASADVSWLIIGDRYGGGAGIKARLVKRGMAAELVHFGERFARRRDNSFEVNPGSVDDYLRLFRELEGQVGRELNIVHLGSLTREFWPTHSTQPSNQDFGFYSLLHIAQAIGERNVCVPITIGIISNGIHDVTGEECLDPETATVLGPCGVIPKEFPNVTCFNIDLPGKEPIDDLPDDLFGKILSEFSGTQRGPVAAYRGRHRWERRYSQVRLPPPTPAVVTGVAPEPGPLKRAGVYLITGGTGGLGLAVAEYLATKSQARIILTKKTAFPPKSMWRVLASGNGTSPRVSRTIKALLNLEDIGAEVEVVVADASDKRRMEQVVQEVVAKFGTINGVIHAAGIVRAGLIQAKTRDIAESVLAPKVYGTRILFDLVKDMNLDFLILFSSVTSLLSPYAESDYSAANASLDAFGCFANTQSAFRTLTINWPGWKQIGQLADLETQPGAEGWKEAALLKAITTKDGLEAFDRILNSDLTHVIVSPEPFGRLVEQSKSPVDPEAYLLQLKVGGEVLPPQRGPMDVGDEPNVVEAGVADIWRSVFGFEQIGIHDNFAELGGHSLLAMQIVAKVRSAYEIQCTIRDVFEAPTIAELSALLQTRIIAAVESLSDDEVQRLLGSD